MRKLAFQREAAIHDNSPNYYPILMKHISAQSARRGAERVGFLIARPCVNLRY